MINLSVGTRQTSGITLCKNILGQCLAIATTSMTMDIFSRGFGSTLGIRCHRHGSNHDGEEALGPQNLDVRRIRPINQTTFPPRPSTHRHLPIRCLLLVSHGGELVLQQHQLITAKKASRYTPTPLSRVVFVTATHGYPAPSACNVLTITWVAM